LEQLRAQVIQVLSGGHTGEQVARSASPMVSIHPTPHTPEAIAAINAPRGRLLQVIPIVQEQTQGDSTLIGIAIERYEHCFVATWHFTAAHTGLPSYPHFPVAAEDDHGNRYWSVPDGGGGSHSRERGGEWRFAYRCFPSLDPDAHSLTLTIAMQPYHGPSGADPATWRFTVAIPPLPAG
jgi:hypothetical protein